MPILFLLLALVCGSRAFAATPPAPSAKPSLSLAAPAISSGPAVLDPNVTPYPRSSLWDFGNLLDAPAGKRGFVTTKGDHFVWQDGTRARFWGINVANTSLQEPDADIDRIVDNFRSAGFNLLRLHHFDERGGIIDLDAPDSRRFVAERLRKLDYWIYRAKQAGIYVYLDLLDYRRFKEGDGVPNAEAIGRAARPYNVFDPRLIELQKEYARKLMRDHVNPYTGLAYADDPAIVMLEIYDESGLYMRRGSWRTMPEPYATNFKKLWNDWLRTKYKSTGELMGAWTDARGVNALQKGESLENGTIEVPALTWNADTVPVKDRIYATLPRRNDGARFAYDVHIKFFKEMRDYLRNDLGVRIPVTATGRFEDIADLKSMAAGLDFIGSNFYYDHPYWAKGSPAWQPPSYFHNHNPMSDIDDRSMAAAISLARIKGKPFVVREWNYCWPNRNRAAGMVEAATYAALHDIDAMILFVYETRPTARVSYFNVRSDPTRWGLCGVAAQIFLKGLIQPSRHKIVIPYNNVDTFTYTRYHQPFYALGWATRVENDFYDGDVYRAADKNTDLILSPGRSGIGRFEGAPAVVHTSSLVRDLAGRTVYAPQYLAPYGLSAVGAARRTLTYDGLLFDSGTQRDRDVRIGLPLAPITAAGLRPIGYSLQSDFANGFVDPEKKQFIFGSLEPFDILRAALDAMDEFHGVENRHDATEQNVFSSDTGEMLRDAASGRLVVSAPGFQALAGNLWGVGRVLAPGLQVRNVRSGTLVALALDGQPITKSKRFLVKMVTDARNADELSGRDPRFVKSPNGQWRIDVLGRGPVTTFGKASSTPISVGIEGKALVDVYLERGSWELLVDGDKWEFYCDTPGAKFTLHRAAWNNGLKTAAQSGAQLQHIGRDGQTRPLPNNSSTGRLPVGGISALFPRDAAFVRAVN
ncbi:MAG TPA: beta-galactosidase [Abditibacteriaceae bacterium]